MVLLDNVQLFWERSSDNKGFLIFYIYFHFCWALGPEIYSIEMALKEEQEWFVIPTMGGMCGWISTTQLTGQPTQLAQWVPSLWGTLQKKKKKKTGMTGMFEPWCPQRCTYTCILPPREHIHTHTHVHIDLQKRLCG